MVNRLQSRELIVYRNNRWLDVDSVLGIQSFIFIVIIALIVIAEKL